MGGNRRTAVAAAVTAGLVLAGCGAREPRAGATVASPTASSVTPSPSETVPDGLPPGPVVDDCLTGRWVLDVADYESRSTAWLEGAGVPLQDLEMTGGQRLDLTDGFLRVSSDLSTTATVPGREISWTDASAGGGDLELADGTFSVSDFAWQARPEVPPRGAPSVPPTDWSQPVAWTCTDGALELRGEGAPLTTRWVRP